VVLDSIKEITSIALLKRGKSDWIAVYIPKETILKEMAAKIELVKLAFLLSQFRNFLIHLVC
jgi:hypothetical protein